MFRPMLPMIALLIAALSAGCSREALKGGALGPIYFERCNKVQNTRYRTVAFPLWHEFEDSSSTTKLLVPLAAWKRDQNGNLFASWLYSQGRCLDVKFVNVGTILFHRFEKQKPGKVNTSLLASMIGWETTNDPAGYSWHVFPIVSYGTSPDFREFGLLLSNTHHSRNTESQDREKLRNTALVMTGMGISGHTISGHTRITRDLVNNRYLICLAGRRRSIGCEWAKTAANGSPNIEYSDEQTRWFFPFFYSSRIDKDNTSDKRFNVLWRLYATEITGQKSRTWVMFVPIGKNQN